ncbi:MAG: hypothetical protein CL661_01620 [Bacteroidetes bacterium]|nr:hypothetical protein [Bacteroidota bacterium]|tara:strand:- start:211 stop:900 length:690 start_codon:yes stop_codon:yes gene_type:complete
MPDTQIKIKLMNENSNVENEILILSDKDIFTKIWTSPRLVFKYLNDNKYDNYVYILLFLAGITRAFDKASLKDMGDNQSLLAVVLISIILGGLFGWITFYIYAALMSWTGEWLDGKGDAKSLLRIISYGMLPSIVALLLLIPQIALFGNEIFQSDIDITNSGLFSIIIYYLTTFSEVVLGFWTLVLLVIGISEVQKTSIWKSILNMIFPGLIIIGSIAIIAMIISILRD